MKKFTKKKEFGARSFGGGNRPQRPMLFKATCDQCGADCEVPFKPNGQRPVLCHSCFKKSGPEGVRKFQFNKERPKFGASSDPIGKQLEIINTKLDRILRAIDEA